MKHIVQRKIAILSIILFLFTSGCRKNYRKDTYPLNDGGKLCVESWEKRAGFEGWWRTYQRFYIPPGLLGSRQQLPGFCETSPRHIFEEGEDRVFILGRCILASHAHEPWKIQTFVDDTWPISQLRLFLRSLDGGSPLSFPETFYHPLYQRRHNSSLKAWTPPSYDLYENDRPWLDGWMPKTFDLKRGRMQLTKQTNFSHWPNRVILSKKEKWKGDFLVDIRWELDIEATQQIQPHLTSIPFPDNLSAHVSLISLPKVGWNWVDKENDSEQEMSLVKKLLLVPEAQLVFEEEFPLSVHESYTVAYTLRFTRDNIVGLRNPVITPLWGDANPTAVCISVNGMWLLLEIGKEYLVIEERNMDTEQQLYFILRLYKKVTQQQMYYE